MPGHYCFLCASDEGVFLDVTPDNRNAFGDQIETCLGIEINDILDLSNKICYKCAYELDQCTKFVEKYKKSREQKAKNVQTSKPCCFLCHELVDRDRIFDLTKDKSVLFNPLRKIRSIFSDDVNVIKKKGEPKLICLTCRYNLDILYDLKRIYRETISNLKALINEEINYSNFPKVHTDVVNRKTTITTFSDITFYGSITSDSDSNEQNMARNKRRVKGNKRNAQIKLRDKSKARNCDKCHNMVANGIDMYRFYHTGLTVCKNCWITMDPNDKPQRRKHQMQSNLAETKLCAVFLTDVLSKELCKEKIHEEKNKDNNSGSYSSSQEETKSSESSPRSVSSRTSNHIVNGKARQGKKRRIFMEELKEDVEHTPMKVTRLNKECANASEIKSTRASIHSEQSSAQSLRKRTGSKRIIDKSSDSDGSVERKETRSSSSSSNNKLNDRVNKPSRKKQKLQSEETSLLNALSDSSEISNEDSTSLRRKTRGATRLSSTTATKSKKDKDISRTRSSSRSSTEMTPTKFKSPKSSAQSESKTEYTCDLCNMKFDTKLSNTKHKLTHLKQAALKLEKLPIQAIKENSEVDSQNKISKEVTSCSSRTASSDKHIDDSLEDIAINVEDDTEEEIFSLSSKESAEKKTEKEANDESGDIIDRPDMSESPVEEESANDRNVEVKKSEQCKESTVVSDGAEEIEDDENSRNKDIKNKHTTNDKTSANRDSDNSKDKNAQKTVVAVAEEKNVDEKGDKNVDIENDTEVYSTKEKTINECNNDEENPQEEILHDREMSSSPILLTHKKSKDKENYSESCKNNLENNCTDDKEEIIEEPEIMQYDLTDESLKKDTEELKEKYLSNNEIEILSDSERNSNDITVVNEDKAEDLENQHDRSNEENMEVVIIADSDTLGNVKDIVNPDLSNGEKSDEIKDGDEADVMVVPINSDSIDDKANHKEEIIPIDNSKGTTELVDEINELEELVKDNVLNNKDEVQENFACVSDNSSVDAASEILKEVFDLAAAEVQQREESNNVKSLGDIEMETLENISREIRKSADMPSLDPINMMEIDDDNGITLN